MRSTPIKVLLAAAICYVGAYVANYIDRISAPSLYWASDTHSWSIWDYLSLLLLMCALALTVAGLKLLRAKPRKKPSKVR